MKNIFRFFIISAVLIALCTAANALTFDASCGTLQASAVSPGEPTSAAVLRFEDLPSGYFRCFTLRWYRDGVPVSGSQKVAVRKGACFVFRTSFCFSEDMPDTSTITAVLSSGHLQYSFDAKINIFNYDHAHYERLASLQYPYRIDVGRFQNVVLIWAQDENGEYSLLQNAFCCSTGKATPRGTFRSGTKLRWHLLYGSEETDWQYVYGQYITRITNSILFHSVPYYTQSRADLESVQFNLLGTRASQGCIRLNAENAKWIYDHVPVGTEVNLIDTLELPCDVPVAPRLDLTDPRCTWDPTDQCARNPWLEGRRIG